MEKIIAIVNPNKGAYSETFIEAHRIFLKGTIHYLYGGQVPIKSTYTKQDLIPSSFWGSVFFHIKYIFYKNTLSRPQYAFKCYLKKHNIQVVLAEYGTTGAQIYSICRQLKIPLIVHFHGSDASTKDVLLKNKNAYQEMFLTAKYIIGVSKVMITKLKQLGVPDNKLIYNTYGPNESFLKINNHHQSKTKLFVSIGRFVDKKAPYYTIIAFSKLLKKHPNAKLIMGGDGPLLATCINLANYLNIKNKVEFPGPLSHNKVKEFMSLATAYVQHSITAINGDMEGTPVGIIEASAAGLPVISTNHAGIPDVIIHNKTGLLCEEHDYNKMAEHMIWIIENPEKAIEMGKEGKINIKNNFSMEKHIQKLNEIVEKAINE